MTTVLIGPWNDPNNPYLNSGRGQGTAAYIDGAGVAHDWEWPTAAQRAQLAAGGWSIDAFRAAGYQGAPTNAQPSTVRVDTAVGTPALPTHAIVDANISALPPGTSVTTNPVPDIVGGGAWYFLNDGPLWISNDTPAWVRDNLIWQHGGMMAARPGEFLPIPPSPVPVAPGDGTSIGPAPAQGPGVTGLVGDVLGIAGRIRDAVGGVVGGAADAVSGIAGGLLAQAGKVIETLAPTVSELALGLTSRFGDLASFIGDNLASVGEFASSMADGIASGLSTVVDDALHWLLGQLMGMVGVLVEPLRIIVRNLYGNLQPGGAI